VTATHFRLRFLLPLASLFLLLPGSAVLLSYADAAPPASPPEVLQAVHTDALHTTYDGSALKLNTRIGTGEHREADPAGLIFNLEDKASAKVELPDLPPFAFLGSPGAFVWIAPESQDPELIWPGWDTETIPEGALQGDAVDLTLLNSQGPGNVEVFFNYDGSSPTVPRLFSSADPAFKTLHQPVGRHVHANWSFSALGTYTLTFQATAITAGGTQLTSGPVDYTFVVGPYEPPAPPTGTAHHDASAHDADSPTDHPAHNSAHNSTDDHAHYAAGDIYSDSDDHAFRARLCHRGPGGGACGCGRANCRREVAVPGEGRHAGQ
jgi:surface-anchored protein